MLKKFDGHFVSPKLENEFKNQQLQGILQINKIF